MNIKHQETKTRLYNIWSLMKQRCSNKKAINYKDYGGRGITICPEWTNDYTKFRDWALNNGYAGNLTIDRIKTNDNYEPNNCRWVTIQINGQNQRTTKLDENKIIEIRQKYKPYKYTAVQLAKEYNVKVRQIHKIIKYEQWNNI